MNDILEALDAIDSIDHNNSIITGAVQTIRAALSLPPSAPEERYEKALRRILESPVIWTIGQVMAIAREALGSPQPLPTAAPDMSKSPAEMFWDAYMKADPEGVIARRIFGAPERAREERRCPSCGGNGAIETHPGYAPETCTMCEGTGSIAAHPDPAPTAAPEAPKEERKARDIAERIGRAFYSAKQRGVGIEEAIEEGARLIEAAHPALAPSAAEKLEAHMKTFRPNIDSAALVHSKGLTPIEHALCELAERIDKSQREVYIPPAKAELATLRDQLAEAIDNNNRMNIELVAATEARDYAETKLAEAKAEKDKLLWDWKADTERIAKEYEAALAAERERHESELKVAYDELARMDDAWNKLWAKAEQAESEAKGLREVLEEAKAFTKRFSRNAPLGDDTWQETEARALLAHIAVLAQGKPQDGEVANG